MNERIDEKMGEKDLRYERRESKCKAIFLNKMKIEKTKKKKKNAHVAEMCKGQSEL